MRHSRSAELSSRAALRYNAGSPATMRPRSAMIQDELKRSVARAAIAHIVEGEIVGVGTGSTANCFIDELAAIRHRIRGAVASSEGTRRRLEGHGIAVLDLNQVERIPVYVDGADEINAALQMIKGGGGALTREKIVANACERFVCIIDASKEVSQLGRFPLPIEVIPMARSLVGRALVEMGGMPVWREGVITDNGHWIIDVTGLDYSDPDRLEARIDAIAGVVSNGLFCRRRADLVVTDGVVRTPAAP